MSRDKMITDIAWTSFTSGLIAGAICALLALGSLLVFAVPEGQHPLCLEVDSPIVTLHTDAAACADLPERRPE